MSYETKIVEALKKGNRGLSTLELTRITGLTKTTVIKYLATFRMAEKADFEEMGSSRIWRLIIHQKKNDKKGVMISENVKLEEITKEFVKSPEVIGFAIMDSQGSPLSAILPENVDPERLRALASLFFTFGIKSIEIADLEEFQRIIVEGSKGTVLAYKKGEVLLIAFSKPEAMLGALKMEMEEIAEKINGILGSQVNLKNQ